jgi:hypothetical protein
LTRWQKSPGLLLELGQKSKLRSKLYSRETILPKYEAALASLVQSNAIAS